MFRTTMLATLLLFSVCAVAQINRPSTKPASSTPPPTASRGEAAPSSPTGDGPIAIKQANGVEIKLMSVVGNAADQQVTLNLLVNNPKANTEMGIARAYAVDMGGDEYNDAQGNVNTVLYTDVPKKGTRTLRGIPAKVQTLKFAKFDFWTQATGAVVVVEFRDLKIDWK